MGHLARIKSRRLLWDWVVVSVESVGELEGGLRPGFGHECVEGWEGGGVSWWVLDVEVEVDQAEVVSADM